MIQKLIEKVEIEKFRHLENVEFDVGEKLTVISGGNGTGKTSLLGLIGHIFTYNKKSLEGKTMRAKFSEVFRFSPKFDKGGEHRYKVYFSDGEIKPGESRVTLEKGEKRFRIDVGERKKRGGKIKMPVIFLSLKRLIPIAQERTVTTNSKKKLTEDFKGLYKEFHNKIFALDHKIEPSYTKTYNKSIYAPTSDKYDVYGISAGQDNIGQIILSLLSFKYEKENNEDYIGGILIIDELDATLYPGSQRNLLDLLLKKSGEYNIQVFFTTHSTDILAHILADKAKEYSRHTEFVFIDNSVGTPKVIQDKSKLLEVLASLNHTVVPPQKQKKVNIYFEDEEARIFFRNLTNYKPIRKKCNIQKVNLGGSFYKTLIKNKFPEFKKSVIVLDGDMRNEFKGKQKPKVVFLPGNQRPENIIFEFLDSLPADDVFWGEIGGYTRQVFINNKPANTESRDVMKTWFNNEKKYWGKGALTLFKRWKQLNSKEEEKFVKNLTTKVNSILGS